MRMIVCIFAYLLVCISTILLPSLCACSQVRTVHRYVCVLISLRIFLSVAWVLSFFPGASVGPHTALSRSPILFHPGVSRQPGRPKKMLPCRFITNLLGHYMGFLQLRPAHPSTTACWRMRARAIVERRRSRHRMSSCNNISPWVWCRWLCKVLPEQSVRRRWIDKWSAMLC